MERPAPSIEFEADITPDGTIPVPRTVAALLKKGGRVTVRLSAGIVPDKLRRRHVTEDEIEQIALRQLEERESVIAFLRGEGQLAANRGFRQRAAALGHRAP